MATSRNSGHRDSSDPVSSPLGSLTRLSRYDLLLAIIPLGFALALAGHLALSVPFLQTVLLGSLFGLLALVDALFLNPPVGAQVDDSNGD